MIALDTSALIWAVQGDGAGDQVCQSRLEAIMSMGQRFMVPAPAMAEYLHRLAHEEHADAIEKIRDFANIAPFDFRCASLCARLLSSKPRKKSTPRPAFKVDAMIMSVAIANNAEKIIVKDADFSSLADGRILIVPVETIAVQRRLGFPEPRGS